MSKKYETKKSQPAKPQAHAKPTSQSRSNAFANIEAWLQKNQFKLLFLLPLILGALFATLTFEMKISEGNDDAMYIEAATKYAANYTGYFYTANAPLYPMFLGVVTIFSGLNLTLFKAINSLFFLLHLALMYYAFRRRLPLIVLWPVLVFSSVNSFLLYYASQTYTEMLFLVLQALFFIVFFKWYEKLIVAPETDYTTEGKKSPELSLFIKGALSVGFALFLMTLCRNIAIGMLGAVSLFLLLQKQYRMMFFTIGGYLAVRIAFEGVKAAIWGAGNQYGSQGAILLQKDAYNPAAGQEDISGFITRFFENFNLYISKRLFQILGFKDPLSTDTKTILSLFVLLLIAFAAWRIIMEIRNSASNKKQTEPNSSISQPLSALLVLIYICTMMGLTFLVLQTKWDQPRLVMVFVPMLFMVVLYGFYSYLKSQGSGGLVGYIAFCVLIIGSSFITTATKSVEHFPVLKKNFQGDKYYGYTPDWENYLRMSEWCADNLPKTSLVACRKAPMSFVYGKGMTFFPVYTVIAVDTTTNLSNPDSALSYFKENKVTHVLLANLRRNPNKIDGYIINTMHRMMEPVARKYPQKLKLVKQIGTSEPAYLYEIQY